MSFAEKKEIIDINLLYRFYIHLKYLILNSRLSLDECQERKRDKAWSRERYNAKSKFCAESIETRGRGVKIFEETPRISRRRIGKKSEKVDRLAPTIYPHLSPPPSFHFGSRRDNRATVARRDSGGLILDRFRSYSIRAPYCPQSTLRVVSFT